MAASHAAMAARGELAYGIYRAATRIAAPLLYAHVQWRRMRSLEHPSRWPERFGSPSSPRPPGPLLWFHAVSLGEGLAAIPVIKHCVSQHPNFLVLMTTTTLSAFEVIKDQLPDGIIYQIAPLDSPTAMDNFLVYWDPVAIFLMESELWPNLIISSATKGIPLAVLNARMSCTSFNRWSRPFALPLISLMLSKISLIVPLSTLQAVRYQLLHASPHVIHFAGDLKYAVGEFSVLRKDNERIRKLTLQLNNRPSWMASSIHEGEEEGTNVVQSVSSSTPLEKLSGSTKEYDEDIEKFLNHIVQRDPKMVLCAQLVMLWVHKELMKMYPNLLMILITRHPQHGQQVATAFEKQGLNVSLRSRNEIIASNTNIYVVDTLGELRTLYRVTPIAVIGGSFLPGLAGHNLSEPAAAGCAVLTGPHIGHFSHMLAGMLQAASSSVLQVADKYELLDALKKLLSDAKSLEAHRIAAKHAFSIVSEGVVERVWKLVKTFVLELAIGKPD